MATNFTAQPSRNQIKKPITCTCTSTTTCTYFVDVDVHVLVDACCHLQICFQKVKDFRPSNTETSGFSVHLCVLRASVVNKVLEFFLSLSSASNLLTEWRMAYRIGSQAPR